jgi:cobalt/nickel transport system permease protein
LFGGGPRARLVAAAFAAWCSTVLAAAVCAGQLAWSSTVPWRLALPAMGGVHALIGIGEALITTLILGAIAAAGPDLLDEERQPHLRSDYAGVMGLGLLAAFGLVVFIAPFACSWPDGLERVAAQLGFEHKAAVQPMLHAPLSDYHIPGLASEKFGTILTGLIGTLAAFILAWAMVRAVARKKTTDAARG